MISTHGLTIYSSLRTLGGLLSMIYPRRSLIEHELAAGDRASGGVEMDAAAENLRSVCWTTGAAVAAPPMNVSTVGAI